MESEYRQFGSSDETSVHLDQTISKQKGIRGIVVYILYGVLVLLLLVLLMVTGIKFAHINKEISGVKILLERISHHSPASRPDSGHTPQYVPVQKRIPAQGACRDGWVSFQKSCYMISTTIATWSKAEGQCRSQGGHLLVLNTVDELVYISEITEIGFDFWIGLVERQHEGHWSWVDGTDFNSTPAYWDVGQPDDWDYRENGEDCGQLHSTENRIRRLWNDADCQLSYRYICEMKA